MSSSEQSTTLFRNVRVFDGRSPVLSNGSNVLVRGATIESISTQCSSTLATASIEW